ncbi:macro domain-containing protein [bacterium]|nr:macro domain-containing protein [bacterium]
MSDSKHINHSIIRLVKGDITDLDIEAFVYYATSDLVLGSGFGNSISMRGGPSIKEELEKVEELNIGDVYVSKAGEMKADYIVHAVGPKFQEEDTKTKLKTTMMNSLKKAEEKGIKKLAFPPMGAGFYGTPLPMCADIMLQSIKEYLEGETNLEEIVVCPLDTREYTPFLEALQSLA